MTYHNKTQVTFFILAPPDQVAELDRIFKSHGAWMESQRTHHTGEKALLSYNVSKGPELSNPLDPNSAPTGNTCFVLNEIHESKAGVLDGFEQTNSTWRDFPAAVKAMEKCKVMAVTGATIFNSLWP